MSDGWIPVLVAVIAAASTLVSLWFQRRKMAAETVGREADAAESNVAAALQLINPLRDRIAQLEADVSEMQQHIKDSQAKIEALEAQVETERQQVKILTGGVEALDGQVRSLGHTPVFMYRRNNEE